MNFLSGVHIPAQFVIKPKRKRLNLPLFLSWFESCSEISHFLTPVYYMVWYQIVSVF